MNTHRNTKKFQLRFISIFFMVLAVLFGVEFPGGYCLGDQILTGIGMPAYSGGLEGWHYAGILSSVGLLAAFAVFARTTEHKLRTFSYFLGGVLAVTVLCTTLFSIL